ncbi:PREDICTED: cyclin-D-binding Myb-like transcription factor 1 [Priapulus caudatus]|uniref:Cyclin-D-binding Myb-like transcription factor 1 n=1 Tax=Priapulus caudatus TaxID=37621 RepID=A0ABM1EPL4_PRICU|nr:PREDICTED: cyclin-D-binding Myb-like transcription factor 1 [Priapulus caudatus]
MEETGSDSGWEQVSNTAGLVLSVDETLHDEVADDMVAGDHVVFSETQEGGEESSSSTFQEAGVVDEAGHQVIILRSDAELNGLQVHFGDNDGIGEPQTKRVCLAQAVGDGKTYMITLSDDGTDATSSLLEQLQDSPQTAGVSTDAAAKGAAGDSSTKEGEKFNQSWFTTKEDKHALQNNGVQWKQGQWAKEEISILQENIEQYCQSLGVSDPAEIIFDMSKDERKDFYRTVAKGLQRPLFSVYRRVIRMYDNKNHMGKYKPEEVEKLHQLRAKHGNDWAAVGAELGRSASSVKDRCRLFKDTCNSGKWLAEEDDRLAEAVYELTGRRHGENVTQNISWAAVAQRVVTRTEKQCRTKWLNQLNWKQKGGAEWTRSDDATLMSKMKELGAKEETDVDWVQLSKGWSSVRSPQWLRSKWWNLKRHMPAYQLMPFPDIVEHLYAENVLGCRMTEAGSSSSRTKPMPLVRTVYTLGSDAEFTSSDSKPDGIIVSAVCSLNDDEQADSGTDEASRMAAYHILPETEGDDQQYLIAQPSGDSNSADTRQIIIQALPSNENVTVESTNQLRHIMIDAASGVALGLTGDGISDTDLRALGIATEGSSGAQLEAVAHEEDEDAALQTKQDEALTDAGGGGGSEALSAHGGEQPRKSDVNAAHDDAQTMAAQQAGDAEKFHSGEDTAAGALAVMVTDAGNFKEAVATSQSSPNSDMLSLRTDPMVAGRQSPILDTAATTIIDTD